MKMESDFAKLLSVYPSQRASGVGKCVDARLNTVAFFDSHQFSHRYCQDQSGSISQNILASDEPEDPRFVTILPDRKRARSAHQQRNIAGGQGGRTAQHEANGGDGGGVRSRGGGEHRTGGGGGRWNTMGMQHDARSVDALSRRSVTDEKKTRPGPVPEERCELEHRSGGSARGSGRDPPCAAVALRCDFSMRLFDVTVLVEEA